MVLGVLDVLAPALVAAMASGSGVRRLRRSPRSRRDVVQGCLLLLLGGLALARLGLSYQPWSIPLGLVVCLPVAALLVTERRSDLLRVGAVVAVGVSALAALVLTNRAAFTVLASTVYPGQRRSTGAWTGTLSHFGAPAWWVYVAGLAPAGPNPSEQSSAYLVLGIAAVALVPVISWRAVRPAQRAAAVTALVSTLVMLSWSMVDWPAVARYLVPLNLVPPLRSAAVVGIAATLAFGLVLACSDAIPDVARRVVAAVSAALSFAVTAVAASDLRDAAVPALTAPAVWATAALTAVVVGIGVAAYPRRWALVPMAEAALVVTLFVNPLQVGFGDLTSGAAATAVRAAIPAGTWWASDGLASDALLMANGVPAVSGQQWIGPDAAHWRLLDPDGAYEQMWNRGSAYVQFSWEPTGSELTIANPQFDRITVRIDPCDPALRALHVSRILSHGALDAPCLTEVARFRWGPLEHWVYALPQ